MTIEVRRYIVVKKPDGSESRLETTYCPWCTDDTVCSACSAKAHNR